VTAGSGGAPVRLVLATHNAKKLVELRRILADAGLGATGPGGVELVGLEHYPGAPEVAETGVTFQENALLKAHAIAGFTGHPAVSDDSGLCVDVLGGSPGIFSARWSGRHGDDDANLDLLLAQLADVPAEHRTAHFAAAAALALPDGTEHVVMGRLDGVLATQRRGTNGFGYDPIFMPDGESRTTAQLSPEEKDAISHRGRAFRALAAELPRLLASRVP
jgi:XTP/dITP diphosphohydrolase